MGLLASTNGSAKPLSLRSIATQVGVHLDTVRAVNVYASKHFEEVNRILLKDLKVTLDMIDEETPSELTRFVAPESIILSARGKDNKSITLQLDPTLDEEYFVFGRIEPIALQVIEPEEQSDQQCINLTGVQGTQFLDTWKEISAKGVSYLPLGNGITFIILDKRESLIAGKGTEISRIHAVLRVCKNSQNGITISLKDLASKNGTYIYRDAWEPIGMRKRESEWEVVSSGDSISLGYRKNVAGGKDIEGLELFEYHVYRLRIPAQKSGGHADFQGIDVDERFWSGNHERFKSLNILPTERFEIRKCLDMHRKPPDSDAAFPIAIKILDQDEFEELDAEDWQDFYDDIEQLISLEHPNIIKYYEALRIARMRDTKQVEGALVTVDMSEQESEVEEQEKREVSETNARQRLLVPAVAMEWNEDSTTLFQYLAESEKMPFADVLRLAIELGEVVNYLVYRGIIHNDINPRNIVYVNKKAKLIDFEEAEFLSSIKSSRSVMGSESVDDICVQAYLAGTPLYMPPERFTPSQLQDRNKIDIYSLGVTLYYALTGSLPFPATNLRELVASVQNDPVTRIEERVQSDHPKFKALCELIHKCLEKNPADRISAQEFANRVTSL